MYTIEYKGNFGVMIELKKLLAEKIACVVKECFGVSMQTSDIFSSFEYPPDDSMGDLAYPCFKLSPVLRKGPNVIAQTISEKFVYPELAKAEALGGYLNFFISDDYYSDNIVPGILKKGKDYGKLDLGKGGTVVLDYSSPNICKPFHVGHLGSTVIGHSIKKLHEFVGYKCVGVNHLGDWGTQFGKQILAYKMWGDKKTVEEGGVDELVKLYVRFHQEAEDNPELNDQARLEFHKLETGDKENTELWKWFVELTLAECNRSYSRLGIEFDSYAGESFYTDKMPAQVEKLKKSGLLKIDNGASIVDLSEYNMPPCLILKSDGSTLYPTRDIAAAVYRYNTYKFDKCIYVTSSQQKLHFQQLFKVIELMGYDFADKLVHVSYGTISVDGEKLSTRAGNAVLIRDLIDSAVTKVKEIMKEKSPDLENPDEVAEQIGVGAVVFYYLMNDRIKDTNFVMSEALSFDGNSGPYAQYTYARTCQLLNKAKVSATDKLVIKEKSERDLAKVLSKFSEAVLSAVKDYEPSDVTRYILDVCTAFNRFYHDCPILNAEDENVAATRVALTKATNTVLGNALPLICMKTPTKI